MNIKVLKTLAAAISLLASSGVYAVTCTTASGGTTNANTSDVSYSHDHPTFPYESSTACHIFTKPAQEGGGGNIDASDLNALWNVPTDPNADPLVYPYGMGDFQDAGKDQGTSGSGTVTLFGGNYIFTITALDDQGNPSGIDDLSGMYSILATLDPNDPGNPATALPFYIDFVLGLKGSTSTGAYLFDNAYFDGSGGGQWRINFVGASGTELPELSNMPLFVREGTGTEPPLPPQAVPEPGALGLVALGLLAAGAFRRRRKHE